ncbi:metallophosphoesterase [Photobacterium sp. SDRW27]|uniref:metallophosphoesterase n=1 Tax=Photobacterium obscurum TaxID=2829490 RepID=UPI002242F594|nr:metallophosphoesterase [Photobacterium obscurum]MCW8328720.1 metallophosphoesterase [Photobacterium obscurum]
MRVQYQSDLHLEFMPEPADYSIPQTDADVIVLAGDIGVRCDVRYIDWVLSQTRNKFTIVVAGNHEPYQSTWQKCIRSWRNATRGTHVHFLECESIEAFGARFLGATLFTDYDLFGSHDESMICAAAGLNDHRQVCVEPTFRAFTPSDALEKHIAAIDFLEAELGKPYIGKTVVVTHHAPSPRCLAQSFRDHYLAPAYASDLEHIMVKHEITAWFHGHLHYSVDFQVHHTRVLCNPRGYWPHQLNADFEPSKIVVI